MTSELLNTVQTTYLGLTNGEDTIKKGYEDGVEISYKDGVVTFTEKDGDIFTVDAKDLSANDLNELAEALGSSATVKSAKKSDKKDGDDDKTTQEKLDANKEKLAKLEEEWNNLNSRAESLKSVIEDLNKTIKENLDEALDKQEKITEEEQERIEKFVDEQIEQFKKDKENGKEVSIEDLKGNIQEGMAQSGFDAEMSNIVSNLVVTDSKMKTMDDLLEELGATNLQMKSLTPEMDELEEKIAEQEAAVDPIGFTDENGNTYEFVIDKDGNNELSNFAEFLGSKNYFDDVKKLDSDKSGVVDTDEMVNAGVMVLVKDKDGNQSLKSIDEAFGSNGISIDVSTYKKAEKDTTADNGQTLLGNFDIKVGDKEYNAYSTLDSADYLKSNYTFTDENPDAVKKGDDEDASDEAAKRAAITKENDDFIEEYKKYLEQHQDNFAIALDNLGLNQDLIDGIKEYSEMTGELEAQKIIDQLKEEKKEEDKDEDKEDNDEA